MWDDAPGGKSENGLQWFINNDAGDETLVYKTTDVNVNTSTYPILEARADTTDGMDFKIGFAYTPTAECTYPNQLQWLNAQANQGPKTKSFTLRPNKTVQALCLSLTDNHDDIAFGRTAALIDFIRLKDDTGKIDWFEDFAGSP